jgi:hypothetical protein
MVVAGVQTVTQRCHAGFAMLDVLVALLLLAVTLTGACATLVQTMRATHGALLATQAVDLAADLIEELHDATSATQVDALLAAWRARVSASLPVAGMEPDEFAALALPVGAEEPATATGNVQRRELRLRWRDVRAGGVRQLTLPVAIAFTAAPP